MEIHNGFLNGSNRVKPSYKSKIGVENDPCFIHLVIASRWGWEEDLPYSIVKSGLAEHFALGFYSIKLQSYNNTTANNNNNNLNYFFKALCAGYHFTDENVEAQSDCHLKRGRFSLELIV